MSQPPNSFFGYMTSSEQNNPAPGIAQNGSPGSASTMNPQQPRNAESNAHDNAASAGRTTLRFNDEDLAAQLRSASASDLDAANFGIIEVDDEGEVKSYNRYESELSGLAPDAVRGRNFFAQVAPCCNNRLFRGRFKRGLRDGYMDETFMYTFTYKMKPTLAEIRLLRSGANSNWILVKKC